MNFPRIALAAVVAWFVSLGLGFVINDFVLTNIYAANRAVLRPDDAVMANLPIGFVFLLVGFFAFAYAYAKGYEGSNGVMEGVRFGVLTALVVTGFGLIWTYVMFPITAAMAAALIVDSIVEFAIYGAIVGAIYRPVVTPMAQKAPAL